MPKIKKLAIILPAAKAKADTVIHYAKAVHTGTSANAATFPAPTITMVDFKAAIDAAEAAQMPDAPAFSNQDFGAEGE